ncbi:hypothetical protein E2320_016702 [Naja naja]|nr:hypothetical protein E2320_016702 [Naja naja]
MERKGATPLAPGETHRRTRSHKAAAGRRSSYESGQKLFLRSISLAAFHEGNPTEVCRRC